MADAGKIGRYIISGGTGALVNIGVLFSLTHYAQIWYLASSICAFIASFVVSFSLQRVWTFQHRTFHALPRHTLLYFSIAIANIFLNTALVFFFVEYIRLWYVLAQICAGLLIAFNSFFIYRKIFA